MIILRKRMPPQGTCRIERKGQKWPRWGHVLKWPFMRSCFILAMLLVVYPVSAATNTIPVDHARLAQIEDYLNSIDTVEADFVQVASTGQVARGKIFISRPGQMRVDYAPPSPILIIADGTFLIYYDRELEQVSYLPLSSTPADVLLDENIRLNNGELRVIGMAERDGLVEISVHRHDNPGEGQLTLVFSMSPITLERWQVIDSQGIVTTVSLERPQFGVSLDEDLFEFEDPAFFRDDFN